SPTIPALSIGADGTFAARSMQCASHPRGGPRSENVVDPFRADCDLLRETLLLGGAKVDEFRSVRRRFVHIRQDEPAAGFFRKPIEQRLPGQGAVPMFLLRHLAIDRHDTD